MYIHIHKCIDTHTYNHIHTSNSYTDQSRQKTVLSQTQNGTNGFILFLSLGIYLYTYSLDISSYRARMPTLATSGFLVFPFSGTWACRPWAPEPYSLTHRHTRTHSHTRQIPAITGLRNPVCPVAAPGSRSLLACTQTCTDMFLQ